MRRRLALAGTVLLTVTAGGGVATGAQGPGAARQDTWHSRQAGVSVAAQEAGREGQGIVVAVLDTWIDVTHPDLEGRALGGAECLDGVCRTGMTRDACDHGTHVAGTVASTSYGTAPGSTVLPVQVLRLDDTSGECVGSPDDVAAGIRFAVSKGARVINLSLGEGTSGDDRALPEAVRAAATAGVLVVLSAGNDGASVPDRYGDQALVVAATASDGGIAAYSERGEGIDLAAPGGDAVDDVCTPDSCITSLFPEDRYAVAAGTSMAAPMVSGASALLLAQRPDRTRRDVIDLLVGTARPMDAAGDGLLDVSAALGVTSASPRSTGAVPLAQVAPTQPPGLTSPVVPLPTRSPLPGPVLLASAQQDPEELPAGLVVGALLVVLAAGTATAVQAAAARR